MLPGNHDYFSIDDEDIAPIITARDAISNFLWHLFLEIEASELTMLMRSIGDLEFNTMEFIFDDWINFFEQQNMIAPALSTALQDAMHDTITQSRDNFHALLEDIHSMFFKSEYNLNKYHQFINPEFRTRAPNTFIYGEPNDYYFGGNWPVDCLAIDSGYPNGIDIEMTLTGLDELQQAWIESMYTSENIAFIFTHAPVLHEPTDPGMGEDDPTHIFNHDEKFLEWLNSETEHPTIEMIITGHAHSGNAYIWNLTSDAQESETIGTYDWLLDSYTGRDRLAVALSDFPYRTIYYSMINSIPAG